MKKTLLLPLAVLLIIFGCEHKPLIEGLWLVKSVKVGEEDRTPYARWIRFNSDLTQESGNGRFQHSYGTWKLNGESHELSVENSNGLEDLNPPFKVMIDKNKMVWERTEEGQDINMTLVRSSRLPETYGDKILGLWHLERATGQGNYFEPSTNNETKSYLFFRWDKRFVIASEKGSIHGIYNVHGHQPEVELVPYGEPFERTFWNIQFEANEITLTLLNTDRIVARKFKRIHKFPDE
ncbi:hypothetical protein [Aestuariivivens sediminis]|uniref:hypothetical protein n=1 Tax=Aestuariivivens sediminis TaxID=2913557 RepID=UPI001F58F139|nr:hypothetical protein [Aestuariivivens sediminis]